MRAPDGDNAGPEGDNRSSAVPPPLALLPVRTTPPQTDPRSSTRPGPIASIRLDRAARRAFVEDRELPLTTQLFDLLAYFLDHRSEAVSFEDLASEVWSYPNGAGDHHFLHTAVYRLRRILETVGIDDLIDGIRGFGYRISDAPEQLAPTDDSVRAIAIFDPTDIDGPATMFNNAAVELTGHTAEKFSNVLEAFRLLWAPEDRRQIEAAIRHAHESGCSMVRDRQLIRADGSTVTVDLRFNRLNQPQGRSLCMAELIRVGE